MFEEEILKKWSIESNFNYSLKRTAGNLSELDIIKELKRVIRLNKLNVVDVLNYSNDFPVLIGVRVKSLQSILLKINRHPYLAMHEVFNDILGIRVCGSYEDSKLLETSHLRKVDMRKGKKHDDGYRGLHFYYQKSNQHYPIEIQWWNEHDEKLNLWLHENTYKFERDNQIASKLRKLYDTREISSSDFEEVYNDLYYS